MPDLPVPGQYDQLEHCYLMSHWPGLREALKDEDDRLEYWTQKYHEAAPLRARYGITVCAPPKHGPLYYKAKRALADHDAIEAMLEEIRTREEVRQPGYGI